MKLTTNTRKPFTPVRRLLLNCIRPTTTLGKRPLPVSPSTPHPNYLPLKCPHHPLSPPKSLQVQTVALQNTSPTYPDTIIITTLPTVPFCCHAHLHSMPRDELVSVAFSLNARLPHAMHIDLGPARSDVDIRRAVEVVVGLRARENVEQKKVPGAPKATRSRSITFAFGVDVDKTPMSPGSPLAGKSRSRSQAFSMVVGTRTPRLEVLTEEDDEDTPVVVNRPIKKRKVKADSVRSDVVDTPTRPTSLTRRPSALQRRILARSKSERIPGTSNGTRTKIRMTEEESTFTFDPSFLASAPRYKPRNPVETSTPRKLRLRSHTVGGYPFGLSDPENENQDLRMRSPSSPLARSTPRRLEVHKKSSESELTFGIDGMTMEASGRADDEEDNDADVVMERSAVA